MIHRSARALAGIVAAGTLLAGCSSDPDTTGTAPSPGSSASATSEASTSASPSTTLTAEEQRAFDEATQVVLAYRQTITDLYSGARTNLNDLNRVAAGELRDQGLRNIQQSLSDGWRYEPEGAQIRLASASLVEARINDDPATVVVRACVDTTAVTGVEPGGKRIPGIQEELDYTVTRTQYLPDPGWAVTKVSTVSDETEERSC
jgi:hypothetical protein